MRLGVKQKMFSLYHLLELRQEIPEHVCNVNHTKGSGIMEASLGLQLIEDLFQFSFGKARVAHLMLDDDTTLRSHCQNVSNGGKLNDTIKEPEFLDNPGYRIKVMVATVFKLVTKNKDPDRVTNIDALRLKTYTSYYIMQNRSGDFEEFVKSAYAPVEHLFDNHESCSPTWCW